MMIIRDPIHGIVSLTEEEKDLLNSSLIARLRWIRQTSMAFYVYPGLTHTRFEHSIGTMYIAGKMAFSLSWDVRKARLLALLHDIGHPAFSHDGEIALMKEGLSRGHEAEGERLLREHYPELWKELRGAKEEALISFALGADRMDYLRRDSYHAGVPYGVVEQDYIIKHLTEVGEDIGITEKAVEAVESFLIARFHMFTTVYMHKTSRIISAMIHKMLRSALRQSIITKEDLYTHGDEALLHRLREELRVADHLYRRRLYKRWRELKVDDEKLIRELEELSLEGPFAIYYTPAIVKDYTVKVKTSKGVKPLEKLSDVGRMLKKAQKKRVKAHTLLVAVEPGKEGEVEEIIKELGGS